TEACVTGAIHLAHPAGAEQVLDLEDTNATSGQRPRHRPLIPAERRMLRGQSSGLRALVQDFGGRARHVVVKGISGLPVEAQERLDLRAQGWIDVMLDVVRLAIRWRSVGELAKEGERLGVHSERRAPRCRL